MPKKPTLDFIEFIREQGIVGFAVGFILGGSVSKVVTSLVNDIINPFIGAFLGSTSNLSTVTLNLNGSQIATGKFLVSLIDFITIAAVVYLTVRVLRLDRLDKK